MIRRIQAALCITIASSMALALALPAAAFLTAPFMGTPDDWHFLTPLASIPDDGVPRLFVVYADDHDAWVRNKERIVGRVFLVRQPGATEVQAFHAISRRGMSIHYDGAAKRFEQACWSVFFSLDGKPLRESDRGIDDMVAVPVTQRGGSVCIREIEFLAWR